jgi:hypothetical protein
MRATVRRLFFLTKEAKPVTVRPGLRAMKSGIWNLGFGLIAVLAGATGGYALPGTSSPTPLIVVGAAVAAFGLFQLARSTRRG